jgi:hypothetical protein
MEGAPCAVAKDGGLIQAFVAKVNPFLLRRSMEDSDISAIHPVAGWVFL